MNTFLICFNELIQIIHVLFVLFVFGSGHSDSQLLGLVADEARSHATKRPGRAAKKHGAGRKAEGPRGEKQKKS